MEAVAICIRFEDVSGTGGGFGLLAEGDPVKLPDIDGAGDDCCAEARRGFAAAVGVGSGGGNGDMETAEMDAE